MSRKAVLSAIVLALVATGACGETNSDVTDHSDAATGGGAGTGGGVGTGGGAGTGAQTGTGAQAGTSGSAGTGGGGTDSGPMTCVDGGLSDASVQDVIASSCAVAVVRVSRLDGECSGAGGTHVTLDVVAIGKGGPVSVVAHGGHAYYPAPDGPDKLGELFVAGIDPFGQLVPRPDNPGWCLVGLPPVDGAAHTLLAAPDEAQAKALMASILSG